MKDLQYPIGRFDHQGPVSGEDLRRWISEIEALPAAMRRAVEGLTTEQLDTPYRPGGWSIRQVVHHVPDSHMNSYIRIKWALTEPEPEIKTYDENGWAALADYELAPISLSLEVLQTLHARWVVLLRSLSDEQLGRRFVHPVTGPVELARTIGSYAWHGRHHLAHITSKIDREGWNEDDGPSSFT